jgi:hypothetical protein
VAPDVYLVRVASPVVSSILLPDSSLAFNIDLAEILPTSNVLFAMKQREQLLGAGKSVEASNVVVQNPAASSAAVSPDQQYSNYVREELIDALVNSGWMLPVAEGQWLTVQVTPVNVAVKDALYRNPSRRLILSIRGEDLAALRQKTLTREDAKLRIVDRRF